MPERRPCDRLLLEITADDTRSVCALGFDHARIDRVDPNFPRPKLLRQHAGHRVDRAFRRGVDDRIGRIEIARYGADIDHAAALVAKELRRLLCRQQQAQYVDVEMPVKVLFRDLLERQKVIDAGVVAISKAALCRRTVDLANLLSAFFRDVRNHFLQRVDVADIELSARLQRQPTVIASSQ